MLCSWLVASDICLFLLSDYDNLANTAMHVTKNYLIEQSVLIIQPYIKWGPKKSDTSPDIKLQEAEALVRSLPMWSISLTIKVPLESLDKRTMFGKGKVEEIKQTINSIRGSGGQVNHIFGCVCLCLIQGLVTANMCVHQQGNSFRLSKILPATMFWTAGYGSLFSCHSNIAIACHQ